MPTVSPLQLCFKVCLLALPLLILGCANRDQKNLRMFIEQNQPFQVQWSRADRRPPESEEESINNLLIDTGSKIVREKRDAFACNQVNFELRLYDHESTDPPELIHDKVNIVSKVTAAIKELSSAESY
jgi:hypothetical protein